MHGKRVFGAMVAAAAALALGCQQTGLAHHPDGGDGVATTITYTPAGCTYQVKSPQVDEAAMGTDAVGASSAPTHVHVSWAGVPATTFAVNWRTDTDTKVTQLLYGTDQAAVTAADGAGAGVTLQEGHTLLFKSFLDSGATRVHEVHVCGQQPATRYYYKVGGPGAWSAVNDVRTGVPKGNATPFKFSVTGDSRNGKEIWAQVQETLAQHEPDFELFSGDAVAFGPNQPEWDEFFEASTATTVVQDVLAHIPMVFVDGNHEALALNYLVQFALPQDQPGEMGFGKEWYSLDYGNLHLVVLNDSVVSDGTIGGAEADWLSADLAAVDRGVTPWVVVAHHQPAYSCASAHGSNHTLRAAWQPIFDQFKVDFVFSGHDHDYERSRPIRDFQSGSDTGVVAAMGANGVPVDESGTVYIVAAGAGAPLYGVDLSCYHTLAAESIYNYSIVEIDGRTLRFTAYRLDNSVIDSFEYSK